MDLSLCHVRLRVFTDVKVKALTRLKMSARPSLIYDIYSLVRFDVWFVVDILLCSCLGNPHMNT